MSKTSRREKTAGPSLRRDPTAGKAYKVTSWLCYIVGSIFYALSVDIFSTPNKFVPGGLTGISTLINYVWSDFPIGVGIILMNLPLMAIAWRHLGRGFALRTAFVTVFSSVAIDLLKPLVQPFTGDRMLAAIFGGVLSGVGLSLTFMRGATTGGTEVVARLLEKKYPHVPIGRLILLVDGAVIAASAVVYRQVESAMYGVTLVFVTTVVMDEMISGARRTRTVLIVSSHPEGLAAAVNSRIQRGVTLLEGKGAYTGEGRQVLMCAVRPNEVHPLRMLVLEEDPSAFIIVLNSEQVLGNGFQHIHPD